jgi:ABC-2 type transport system ATP-binding protein
MEDLHKRFGDVVALDGCSLSVAPGQMLGFLGPNGAGKTTAMRTIFGLVRPDAGRVTWDNEPLTTPLRRRIGYMPEERGLYPKMKVHRQLVYFGRLHGLDRLEAERAADHWLDVFELSDRADARLIELSHGNQQRVQLATALVHSPLLLVLDEPFAGLDPIAAQKMVGILRAQTEEGVAVLFSSHQLDVVEHLCEDVVIIHQGSVILAGRVSQLRAASSRRYLEVSTPEPAVASWLEEIPGARLVEQRDDRIRLLVDDGIDIKSVAAIFAELGSVSSFSLEPPDLSEIFTAAVRR